MLVLQDIQVELPFPLLLIDSLEYEQKLNEHSQAIIRGMIEDETAKSIAEISMEHTVCKITGAGAVLFTGIPISLEMESVKGVSFVTIKLVSSSFQMDVIRKRRSFQDVSQTYQDIMGTVAKPYAAVLSFDKKRNGTQEAPVIQYDETDWEFLVRLSSYCEGWLVPDVTSEKITIQMGEMVYEPVEFIGEEYTVQKLVQDYRLYQENEKSADESSFIQIQVESLEDYKMGGTVIYMQKAYRIAEKRARLVDGTLRFQYGLKKEDGIVFRKKYNTRIGGVSIKGKVLEITDGYKLKLHLEIDEKQEASKAFAYEYCTPYQAEGSTGWYFMPEIGEQAYLYIPDKNEQKAYVTMVKQKSSDYSIYTQNPVIDYAGIPGDTEFTFQPNEILMNVVDNRTYTWMPEEHGFVVHSQDEIHVHAKGDMSIQAGSFYAQAGQAINLCKGPHSIIVDSVVHFKG